VKDIAEIIVENLEKNRNFDGDFSNRKMNVKSNRLLVD